MPHQLQPVQDALKADEPKDDAAPVLASIDRLRGFILILVIIALEVISVLASEGAPSRTTWILMQGGLVLIFGLVFGLYTKSSGTWKAFGARLGGAAAVGVCVLLAINKLTPLNPNVVVELPRGLHSARTLLDTKAIEPGVQIVELGGLNAKRFLVIFPEDKSETTLPMRVLDADKATFASRQFRVFRSGKLEDAQ